MTKAAIIFWDETAETLFGGLTIPEVREKFDMEGSCDPDISGLEGWASVNDTVYYAHEVDGEINISVCFCI